LFASDDGLFVASPPSVVLSGLSISGFESSFDGELEDSVAEF
jgi:hypothetical protein